MCKVEKSVYIGSVYTRNKKIDTDTSVKQLDIGPVHTRIKMADIDRIFPRIKTAVILPVCTRIKKKET